MNEGRSFAATAPPAEIAQPSKRTECSVTRATAGSPTQAQPLSHDYPQLASSDLSSPRLVVRIGLGVAAALLCLRASSPLAQSPPPPAQTDPMEIWNIELGRSVYSVGEDDFMMFACGSNGGPPGRRLEGFRDFLDCPPEESGLREVYFEYDDERLYWAKAHRYSDIVASLGGGTRVIGIDVMLSVLVDEVGIVQGWRIVTDPRPSGGLDEDLGRFGFLAMARFGEADWDCIDYPPVEGREPAGGRYLDRKCAKTEEDRELKVRIEHYRKPGQARLNQHNLRPNMGSLALYSASSLEIIRDPSLPPLGPVLAPPDPDSAPEMTGNPEVDFLSGASNDCRGCDLSGADLKRRDLAGADLTGSSLVDANLHRANLASAILADTNLAGINLNKAILTQADLSDADLTGAMVFEADLSRTNLDGAVLNRVMAGEARFVRASMANTEISHADFRNALMMHVNLRDSVAKLTYFDRANLFQADLRGAQMIPASFWGVNLRRANADGGNFAGSDFLEADLSEANFSNANFAGSRLFRANLFEALTTNARFAGAILPDGTVAPIN